MTRNDLARTVLLLLLTLLPVTVIAQVQRDVAPLKPWPAPLYWQPTEAENQIIAQPGAFGNAVAEDTRPANSLVFVGMTPCRVLDTRTGSGFTGAFGPPSLVGGAKRTFPIQSSTTCSIPSIAQTYSFNVTIVPPGFVDFVTVGPTPVSTPPTFSTLNGYVCAFSASACVISNAAIVPAGTSGSVDVYASQTTNLIIDINGYYAQQTGITLTQGTATTPSLSFAGDGGTGIFSSGAGTLNIATNGTSRLQVLSNGDVNQVGNLTVSGNVGVGTTSPALLNGATGKMIEIKNPASPGLAITNNATGGNQYFLYSRTEGTTNSGSFRIYDATHGRDSFILDNVGNVGIGDSNPTRAKLVVRDSSIGAAVYGVSNGAGVVGESSSDGQGIYGISGSGIGVLGISSSYFGVYGQSGTSYAGYFNGNVHVVGMVSTSDARLKQDVASLGYGLREVLQLRPVTFNWKDKPETGRQLGLIAQEVEIVLPELVTTEKDAEQTKGLNYIGLVPVTIKAIQQQQAQIEDQQKRISEEQEQILQQQEQNRKLEERLAAVEALLSSKAN